MINPTVNFTTSEAPANSTTKYFGPLHILNILHFLVGLPTHSYVVWLIVTRTGSEVASGFFNLNLSVCEIVNCLKSILFILEMWITCSTFKALTKFLRGLGITGHCLLQCLMCVERYLAVVHPVTFLKYKPLRYRVICCTVGWIITLGSCFCCMLTINSFYIYAWFFLLQFLLFFSIQLFCLVAVLRALKQSGPGERKREKEEENNMKRKAFNVILITTGGLTIIYVPFTISGFFFFLTNTFLTENFTLELYCFVLAGFVQPVLYLNRAGKLRWDKIFNCFVFRS